MRYAIIVLIVMASSPFLFDVPSVQAQTVIDVDETAPCFLNYDAGIDMWKNCGFEENFIKATLMPFEWIMGGYFTLVIVSIIIIITYMKYQTVIYPLAIGIIMLPISSWAFPEMVLGYGMILTAVAITGIIKIIIFKQTRV
jgi:hypothetical protein